MLSHSSEDASFSSTSQSIAPFGVGYQHIFKIISMDKTYWLTIPATFATAYGFTFAAGRVAICMARSGLFPEIFTKTFGKYHTPYVAHIAGACLGYSLVLISLYVPAVTNVALFNVCMLSGFIAYVSQMAGYLVFHYQFPNQERVIKSPLGIYGAFLGIAIFSLGIISIVAFQNDDQEAFISMIILITLYSLFYHLYSKHHQFFSCDEKFIFVVYMNHCKYLIDSVLLIILLPFTNLNVITLFRMASPHLILF